MAFGDRLKAWRLDHGFTQAELENEIKKLTGKKQAPSGRIGTQIAQYEGCRNYPSIESLIALRIITHINLDNLFEDEIRTYKMRAYPLDIFKEDDQEECNKEKIAEINNEKLWKEQHKGCKYKYRKGNFICELTAI